jgi:hypothetical protein
LRAELVYWLPTDLPERQVQSGTMPRTYQIPKHPRLFF